MRCRDMQAPWHLVIQRAHESARRQAAHVPCEGSHREGRMECSTGRALERRCAMGLLPREVVGTSVLFVPLSVDLVRDLPEVGCGLVKIGKRSVDGARVSAGAKLDLDADAWERCHDGSFPALPTLPASPARCGHRSSHRWEWGVGDSCEAGLYPPLFLLYSRRVIALQGVAGLRCFSMQTDQTCVYPKPVQWPAGEGGTDEKERSVSAAMRRGSARTVLTARAGKSRRPRCAPASACRCDGPDPLHVWAVLWMEPGLLSTLHAPHA